MFDGEEFQDVPNLSGSTTLEYSLPLHSGGELDFYENYRHIVGYKSGYSGFLGTPYSYDVPSHNRLDFQVTFSNQDWSLTGYVHNLLDSYDYNTISLAPFLADIPGNRYVTPLAPRQAGLKLTKTF